METDKSPQEISTTQAPLENESIHKSLLNQKGSFLLILGVVVILVLGTGGYLLTMNKNQNPNKYISQPTPTSTQPTPSNETANWKTYTEILSDYSIKYPPTFKPGSTTYVLLFNNLESNFISYTEFIDNSTLKYFQAGQFTLPYQQPSISVLKANGKNLQQSFDYFKQTVQNNQTSIEDTQNIEFKGLDAISFKAKVNVRRNPNQLFLTNIFTVQNDKIYIFSYAPDADGKVQKVFDQILSTINFVKPSDVNTPENVVLNFYKLYLIGANGRYSYRTSPYITSNIEKNLSMEGHDFFCNEPTNDITISNVIIKGGQAEATAHQLYSEGAIVDVTIKLVLENNQWKIDDAKCPQTLP